MPMPRYLVHKTCVLLAMLGLLPVVFVLHPTRGQDTPPDSVKRIAGLESRLARLKRLLFVQSLLRCESHPKIFPEDWTKDPFNARATPILESQRARALAAVNRAIDKYPETLLRRTLQRVYVLGDLTFYKNTHFSGTASNTSLYLVVQSEMEGYTDRFIEATFHREYSTLLLNRYLRYLAQSAWHEINPPDFRYSGPNSWDYPKGQDGGALAIEEGKSSLSLESRPEYLDYGFLTEYSKSSLENDFNEYATALFLNEPQFQKLAETYPAIEKKRDLAIRFYSRIDPDLTPAYFGKCEGAQETAAGPGVE